jgi:drug/metabolite transporter (DMT)-like permease
MVLVGASVSISRDLVGVPLLWAQAVRYGLAALIFVAVKRRAGAGVYRPRGGDWLWLGGIAATGLVLFNVALIIGSAHAEPAALAVAVACAPVLLGAFGPLLEGGTPPRRVLVAAVAVTLGSILVEGTGRTDAAGALWALVILGCEVAFTLLAIPVLGRHGAWGVSLHSVWMATAMLVVAGVVAEGPGALARVGLVAWGVVVAQAVMTVVAFVLWYTTVSVVGAARAGLLTGIAPISAALIGLVAGASLPGPFVWLGMGTVLGGLALGRG